MRRIEPETLEFRVKCLTHYTHEYYNFTKFRQNQIKNKKILLMRHFCKQTAEA